MIAGLTGGIGSGKSTVSKIFEMLGCAVFDSDEAAKGAYFLPDIRTKVIGLLGEQSYVSAETLNKSYISSLVFPDKDLLRQLNQIIHPAVKEMFLEFVKKNKDKPIIKESALLFEAGLEKEMDTSILVHSPDELRIGRVMARDKVTREDVLQRISRQMPQDDKAKLADHIIYNDETRLVIPQVIKILGMISSSR